MPARIPPIHAAFLERALEVWRGTPWLLGVAVAGSWVTGGFDRHSDLDLVVVYTPDARENVLAEREAFAARAGGFLRGFTGEHVGEPRLLVCLYGPPLLHVDLKFVTPEELGERIEDPHVLWERERVLTHRLAETTFRPLPEPDLQWVEDRFWTWVHYVWVKIERGELLETMEGLAYLRRTVLGPLALAIEGGQARGLRRLEQIAPRWTEAVRAAIAAPDAPDARRALCAAIDAYVALRAAHPDAARLTRNPAEPHVREMVFRPA